MSTQVGNFLEQIFSSVGLEVKYYDDKPESVSETVFAFSSSGHRFVSLAD